MEKQKIIPFKWDKQHSGKTDDFDFDKWMTGKRSGNNENLIREGRDMLHFKLHGVWKTVVECREMYNKGVDPLAPSLNAEFMTKGA